MRVFISWSGQTSRLIAEHLRNWLPLVLQTVQPFVSTEDISKGQNWNYRLSHELANATFALIVITRQNAGSQWLNFEAGALTRSLENSSVCPLLIDLSPGEFKGPLSQFQCATLAKEDMFKLLFSINSANPGTNISEKHLRKLLESQYPELEEQIQATLASVPKDCDTSSVVVPSLVDEVFDENYVHNSDRFKKCMRECLELSVLGFAHNRMTVSYSSDLTGLLQRGGKLRVLSLDPRSSAVLEANVRSYSPKSPAAAKHQHRAAIAALNAIGSNASSEDRFEHRLIRHLPPFTLYIFDVSNPERAQAFVWLTPWRLPSEQRPGFHVSAKESPKWYSFFLGQFTEVWKTGAPSDSKRDVKA